VTVPVELHKWQQPGTDVFCLPPDARSLLNFRVVVCTCRDAHLLYHVGLTNTQLRVRCQALQKAWKAMCRDCNLAVTLRGMTEPHWTHLFVDEAAQATEPETLILLSVVVDPEPGIHKVEICLVGDPRQLSPEVFVAGRKISSSALADLNQSWMERLLLRPVSVLGGGQPHLLGPDLLQLQEWMEYSCQENLSVFLMLNCRATPLS
jgi:helicase MOV-10